jgi:excisionase family DNA binding protein
MTEPLLSVAQVARMVGVPLSCAGRWVESGLLPSEAPNGCNRFVRRPDLDAFLAAHNMPPLPSKGSQGRVEQFLTALPVGLRRLMEAVFRREWPGA